MHKLKLLCIVALMSSCHMMHAINGRVDIFADFLAEHRKFHEENISNYDYLHQLNNNLKMFNNADQDAIISKVKKELESKNSPYISITNAHEIAKSAIISHGENMQRIIAQSYYHNTEKINKTIKSQHENISAVLNKTDHIDGHALAPYFGDNLLAKTEQDALHPENKPYLKSEWHYLLSDTPPTPKPSPFDANQRHRMYDDYCNTPLFWGLSEEGIAEIKKRFWSECASCNTEATIYACMQKQTLHYFNKHY